MIKEMRNLNKLPVKTWKWLNVNELTLDNIDFDESIKYNINAVNEINNDDLQISKNINAVMKKIDISSIDDKIDYGVSNDLVNIAKQNCNSSYVIYSKKNKKIEKPVILNYAQSKQNPLLIDNNVIVAEEGSSITCVIKYSNLDDEKTLHNGLTTIYAKKNSNVKVVFIQNMNKYSSHFNSLVQYIGQNANVEIDFIELGSKIVAINSVTDLLKYESSINIKAMYLGYNNMKIDIDYDILHKGENTKSKIEQKGALNDSSEKVFKGTIDFKKGAKKAIGSEEESVILLSPKAKSDAIPILLCSEEDVSGSHAATVGKIDQSKLFYIMSRGFTKAQAQRLIIEASYSNIIDSMPDEKIKSEIIENIQRRL